MKAKLKKAKEAARAAKEAMEASKQATYNFRVQETKVHLAEELAEVCKDYCQKVWTEVLNLVRVPTASE